MTETTITVRGTARAEHEPDCAEVSFTVAATGAEREAVLDAARASADRAADALAALEAAGRLAGWSLDDLRVHAEREWVGEQRSPVLRHRAAVSGAVRLVAANLDALPEVLDLLSSDPLVQVHGVDWSLDDAVRADSMDAVRDAAVRDAVRAAEAYARSLGRASVDVVAIADAGMLGDDGPMPRMDRMLLTAAAASGAGAVELRPEPIELRTTVELRAIAR